MYRTIAIIFVISLSLQSNAQEKQEKYIPFFDIVQANGTRLKATDLTPDQPAMIIYFDPDCDHCVTFINDVMKNAAIFKNAEVVLITYVPLRRLKSYISESGLNNYPQFKAGTEGTRFTVRYHYDVIQFPYVALHDRTGKMFTSFESEIPRATELADMLKGR
jgi:hypothetical protein